jgi:hypothetical protein
MMTGDGLPYWAKTVPGVTVNAANTTMQTIHLLLIRLMVISPFWRQFAFFGRLNLRGLS